MILATTSIKPMLIETQLSEVFDADLFVPSISSMSSLEIILREVELFPSDDECTRALSQIGEIGFGTKVTGRGTRMEIGVKKLLSIIEMARQEPDAIADRLVSALLGLKM